MAHRINKSTNYMYIIKRSILFSHFPDKHLFLVFLNSFTLKNDFKSSLKQFHWKLNDFTEKFQNNNKLDQKNKSIFDRFLKPTEIVLFWHKKKAIWNNLNENFYSKFIFVFYSFIFCQISSIPKWRNALEKVGKLTLFWFGPH